ncbi:lanthionine synthetase LanC family protein [Streptomyces sp. JJ36]|uniref:lanthionine synthetase LanC family protein n=1 Tax=Streptomyces sp. JJ36 TaxID=2736645 RepID=UPI001F1A1CDC|nr:lanthionine synthetase LanC family protein [Streptomyces sp. JJ36]MCF6522987.1 subtilin biosynthesis protein spaC [Streptomyces sp. JJ36]
MPLDPGTTDHTGTTTTGTAPAPGPRPATGPRPAAVHGPAHDLAVRFLQRWSAAPGRRPAAPGDPGVPVLARLVARSGAPGAEETAARAVAVWARTAGHGRGHPGLYDGGLAGTLAGLRLGAGLHPVLHTAADRLRDRLTATATRDRRRDRVGFADYDLVLGPAGTLLALCAGDRPAAVLLRPFTHHLVALCDRDDLPRLRAGRYAGHPQLAWLQGRINTGMGHGVAGLAAALTAAVRHTAPASGPEPELTAALRRATRWLAGQAYDDARGVRSWPGAGLDGTPPPAGAQARQAWCYGNPGVPWALWDAADALGDAAAAERAAAAFGTLAERYDEDFHLFGDRPDDLLGLCHGAGGVLAVADAFRRHAGLPAATALADRLTGHLEERLTAKRVLGTPPAGMSDGLLGGAPGALSALLTARHGADRAWLPCLGLR